MHPHAVQKEKIDLLERRNHVYYVARSLNRSNIQFKRCFHIGITGA